MKQKERSYISIDLKSFYASVECIERDLNPLTTNLVVADESRTEKTICLAVSPSLKKYGISGRARLFEVIQIVNRENYIRQKSAKNRKFIDKTYDDVLLSSSPDYGIDYIVAPPRMAYYIEYSTRIYKIYLKYIAPEDIHVYSIDEVFIDVTNYINTYNKTPKELAKIIIQDILKTTGITATAGIGTNLYLCKVAMDIVSKKIKADSDGVRIAELDEMSYRKLLWKHRPITDFWRVGKGYAKRLEEHDIYTMGDIARCSIKNEDLLYKLFGVNAELLIDHAWGWEPCTIKDIKEYKPLNRSICSGQVLNEPYTYDKCRIVIREMADIMALDLVDKGLVTNQIVLTINYDINNLKNTEFNRIYSGDITTDTYGRKVPKNAHGTINLKQYTSSTKLITEASLKLFEKIINKGLLIRKVNITANHVMNESDVSNETKVEQLNLFTDYEELSKKEQEEKSLLEKERKVQNALLSIKKKYGKNAVLKGISLEEGATAKNKNLQIGGHKA